MGCTWPLSVDTAQVVALAVFTVRYFATDDCSGPELLAGSTPRAVVVRDGNFVTRPDDVAGVPTDVRSALVPGFACSATTLPGTLAFPVSSLRVLGPDAPSLPFTPPLRQELR